MSFESWINLFAKQRRHGEKGWLSQLGFFFSAIALARMEGKEREVGCLYFVIIPLWFGYVLLVWWALFASPALNIVDSWKQITVGPATPATTGDVTISLHTIRAGAKWRVKDSKRDGVKWEPPCFIENVVEREWVIFQISEPRERGVKRGKEKKKCKTGGFCEG